MKKIIITTVVGLMLSGSLFTSLQVNAEIESFDAEARSAIAVDEKTGKIFYAKNAEKAYPIASMTKILTIYLTLEQIKEGKLKWDDKVKVSDYALAIARDYRLSGVPMEENQSYTVKELYEGALIASANSCAILLAEKIGGSEPKFVDSMKKKVESWGIKDAKIINASGINNEYIPSANRYPKSGATEENQMSAKDIAIIASHLLKDYPEVLKTTSKTTAVFGVGTASKVDMTTWNWMLKGQRDEYAGVDGLKTGTTEKAGQCFVGTAMKKKWRIITVVMHANNASVSEDARFTTTKDLMDFVYDNWSKKVVLEKGATFTASKYFPVKDGKKEKVALELQTDVTKWIQKGMDKEKLKVVFSGNKEGYLMAPVEKGTVAGNVSVQLLEDKNGYLEKEENPTTPMVTKGSVEKANFFVLLGRHILEYVHSLVSDDGSSK